MKFLNASTQSLRTAPTPSNLYYKVLGQVGVWLILSFAPSAWAKSTPSTKTSQEEVALKPVVISPQFPQQTGVLPRKLQEKTAKSGIISYQAKDLKSDRPDLQEIMIASSEELSRVDDASTTEFTVSKGSFAYSKSPNRCWRLSDLRKGIRPNCAYAGAAVQLSQSRPNQSQEVDPEIGVLRMAPLPGDPELGTLRTNEVVVQPRSGATDPDLGILRLQERPTPEIPIAVPTPPRQPSAFLIARTDYFKTSNVLSSIDPVDDGLIRTGLTLFYAPPIGPRTFLVTSIDANLLRYAKIGRVNGGGSANYDELRFRAGIFYRITPRLSGEIGWSNQQLFRSATGLQQIFGGGRFFSDQSIRVELSRQDTLSPRLALGTFYLFRWSIADPNNATTTLRSSRVYNTFISTLSYSFSPKLLTALDYQFTWTHFLQQDRDDIYHQLAARVTYTVSPRAQLNIFSGFSFGHSTERTIDFNGFIFGAGLVFNVPIF